MRKRIFLGIVLVIIVAFILALYFFYGDLEDSATVQDQIATSTDDTMQGPNGPLTYPAVNLDTQIILSAPDVSGHWRYSPVKLIYRSIDSEGDVGYVLADLDSKYGNDIHLKIILSDSENENPFHRSGTLYRPDYDLENLDKGGYEESYLLASELEDLWDIKDGDVFELYYVIEAPTVESLGAYCDDSINIFNCEQSFIRNSDHLDLFNISTEGWDSIQEEGDFLDIYPYFIGRTLSNE